MDQIFRSFSRVPIRSSAWIGQVHEAVLLNGQEVVVKVQRSEHRVDHEDRHGHNARSCGGGGEAVRGGEAVQRSWRASQEFAERFDQELDYTDRGAERGAVQDELHEARHDYMPSISGDSREKSPDDGVHPRDKNKREGPVDRAGLRSDVSDGNDHERVHQDVF